MSRMRCIVLAVCVALLSAASASAADSLLINYQGLLTTPGGSPVPNGQYAVTFSIWDDADAGVQKWSEVQSVDVADGRLNVLLGAVNPLALDIFCITAPCPEAYLQVQVGGDPPLQPRTQLVPVPQAAIAQRINGDVETGPGYLRVFPKNNIDHESKMTTELITFQNATNGDTVAAYGNQGGFIEDTLSGSVLQWGQVYGGSGETISGLVIDITSAGVVIDFPSTGLTGDGLVALGSAGMILREDDITGVIEKFVSSQGEVIANKTTGDTIALYNDDGFLVSDATGMISATANKISPNGSSWGIEVGDSSGAILRLLSGVVNARTGPGDLSVFLSGDDFHFENAVQETTLELGGQEIGDAFIKINKPSSGTHATINSVGAVWTNDQVGDTVASYGADGATLSFAQGEMLFQSGSYFVVNTSNGDTTTALSSEGLSFGLQSRAHGLRSFAGGNHAKAEHGGSFVWADGAPGDLATTAPDQVRMRASGGYTLYTDGLMTTGVSLPPGGGEWALVSDSATKMNYRDVDGADVLDKLSRLRVRRWNYKSEGDGIDHIGPTAQEFYNAFGLGGDDTRISSLDPSGVALAAIKELKRENTELQERIAKLEQFVTKLQDGNRQ